jgi:tetratricopeptide (TPR) repeat protein
MVVQLVLLACVSLPGQEPSSLPAAPGAPAAPSGESLLAEGLRVLDNDDATVANTERAIKLLDDAMATGLSKPREAQARADKARALLRLGDLVREKDKKRGMAIYEQAKNESARGVALDPTCADAHFYRGANLGRWAETRGVLQSLFTLPDIKSAFRTTLKLDPTHLEAQLSQAVMDEMLPSLAGGSDARAEATYRVVIKNNPHYTRAMVDFAQFLDNDGRRKEAITWAEAAVAEKAPSRPGDWRRFDKPRAEAMLERWKRK